MNKLLFCLFSSKDDCIETMVYDVFSGICGFFNCGNKKRQNDVKLSREELKNLIEKELDRIERGEIIEIIPEVVSLIQEIIKDKMGANRRSRR